MKNVGSTFCKETVVIFFKKYCNIFYLIVMMWDGWKIINITFRWAFVG
jgi:hypothetical protein